MRNWCFIVRLHSTSANKILLKFSRNFGKFSKKRKFSLLCILWRWAAMWSGGLPCIQNTKWYGTKYVKYIWKNLYNNFSGPLTNTKNSRIFFCFRRKLRKIFIKFYKMSWVLQFDNRVFSKIIGKFSSFGGP